MDTSQDWDTIVLHRKNSEAKKKSTDSASKTPKIQVSKKESSANDSTDAGTHEKVSLSLSKQIQHARLAQKLTQKDLACKICVQPKIIQDYESGKAIPEPNILNKISSTLRVKLIRK